MDPGFLDSEGQPSVLVTCSACDRLHAPESLFTPNPVCDGCQSADARFARGGDSIE